MGSHIPWSTFGDWFPGFSGDSARIPERAARWKVPAACERLDTERALAVRIAAGPGSQVSDTATMAATRSSVRLEIRLMSNPFRCMPGNVSRSRRMGIPSRDSSWCLRYARNRAGTSGETRKSIYVKTLSEAEPTGSQVTERFTHETTPTRSPPHRGCLRSYSGAFTVSLVCDRDRGGRAAQIVQSGARHPDRSPAQCRSMEPTAE
jgi:hypothetical protein